MSENTTRRRSARSSGATASKGPREFSTLVEVVSYGNKNGGFVSQKKTAEENAKAAYVEVKFLHDIPEFNIEKGTVMNAFTALPTVKKEDKWVEINAADYKNRSVEGLQEAKGNGKGAGAAMEVGAIVQLDKCRIKDGNILFNYAKGGLNPDDIKIDVGEENNGVHEVGRPYIGVTATIFSEGYSKKDDKKSYYQNAHIFRTEEAVVVNSMEDINNEMSKLLDSDAYTTKGVTVVGYKVAEEGQNPDEVGSDPNNRIAATILCRPSYEEDEETNKTEAVFDIDKSLEDFKKKAEKDPESMASDIIENIGNPGWKFIAVPTDELSIAPFLQPNKVNSENAKRVAEGKDAKTARDLGAGFKVTDIGDDGKYGKREAGILQNVEVLSIVPHFWKLNGEVMKEANAYGKVFDQKKGGILAQGDEFYVGNKGMITTFIADPVERFPTAMYLPDMRTPLTPEEHVKGIEAEKVRMAENGKKYGEQIRAERGESKPEEPANKAPKTPEPGM